MIDTIRQNLIRTGWTEIASEDCLKFSRPANGMKPKPDENDMHILKVFIIREDVTSRVFFEVNEIKFFDAFFPNAKYIDVQTDIINPLMNEIDNFCCKYLYINPKIIDEFHDTTYSVYTVEIAPNIFVDVKCSGHLCYVMQCEDGKTTFDTDGNTVNCKYHEQEVVAFVGRHHEKKGTI